MLKQKLTTNKYYQTSVLEKTFAGQPLGFIDIGARGGSHSLLEPLHDQVSFLGFEPDLEECAALNANAVLQNYWREFAVLPYALSDKIGLKKLRMMSAPTNTSLLKPDPLYTTRYNMHAKWSVIAESELSVIPLDDVITTISANHPYAGEVVKVDTQGTEYEILAGAKKLLCERTMCIITEVEFFPIYQGQKLFSDVEILLRELGFSFYGFLTLHTRTKKLLNKQTSLGRERLFYADAIFFKDPLSHSAHYSTRQLYVLLTSAILTGFYDFALELVDSTLLQLTKQESTQLQQLITSLSYINPENTKHALTDLVKSVEKDEARVNLHLGKFIDTLNFPNFEDVNLD